MKKALQGLSLILALTLSISTAFSNKDFDYRIEMDSKKGVIAVQHFKNAPYPLDNFDEQKFYEEGFKNVVGRLKVDDREYETRFFGGWFFINLNPENDFGAPSLLTALLKFRAREMTETIQEIGKASKLLAKISEKENLKNPYAGRSLKKDYCNGDGIPTVGVFLPTLTNFVTSTDKVIKSLAIVYGGTIIVNSETATSTLSLDHGVHHITSYNDKMMSASGSEGFYAEIRNTDDGKTANESLRITSFKSWFEGM